jgi:hypothetical protein
MAFELFYRWGYLSPENNTIRPLEFKFDDPPGRKRPNKATYWFTFNPRRLAKRFFIVVFFCNIKFFLVPLRVVIF